MSDDLKEPTVASGSSGITPLVESLGVLRQKISKSNAYLGVLIGFAIFAFALFLSWSSIPVGQQAADGGTSTGWNEKAYLAIFPLALALYPVFVQRAVHLRNLLINLALSFVLLAYNNVINRSTWHSVSNVSNNFGSILDSGFWLGLIAMIVLSVFGVAWSLHTSGDDQTLKAPTSQT